MVELKKLNKIQRDESLTVASLSSNCQMLCDQASCNGDIWGPYAFENVKARAYSAGIHGVIIMTPPLEVK